MDIDRKPSVVAKRQTIDFEFNNYPDGTTGASEFHERRVDDDGETIWDMHIRYGEPIPDET